MQDDSRRKEYLESLIQKRLPNSFMKSQTQESFKYPKKWANISPCTEEMKENFSKNFHPDQHSKTATNHERKDHDSELISRNDHDLKLLQSVQLLISDRYSVNKQINAQVVLTKENLLKIPADAIVNSANEALLGGGGLDAIIHYYAGASLKDEIQLLPNVPNYDSYYYPVKCLTGSCVITSGHNLPRPYILHTVCPYLDEHGQPQPDLLIQCYQNILKYIDGEHISSIAIGALGTGYYGYPMVEAAILSLRVIREYLEFLQQQTHQGSLSLSSSSSIRIILSIPNEIHYEMHEILWKVFFPTELS